MPNQITVSQSPPCVISTAGLPVTPANVDARRSLSQAFQTDDWTLFDALTTDNHTGLTVADLNEKGQNYLHIAIISGSYSIALNLTQFAYQWDVDLINTKDQFGYTPIMYAAESQADHPQLVDMLIDLGAYVGLPEALKSAAKNGHTETAKRLITGVGGDAPKVLAQVLHHDQDGSGMKAAKFLISLGMNPTSALEYAGENHWFDAADALLVLGAKGSEALVLIVTRQPLTRGAITSSAMHKISTKVRTLVQAGSDVAAALTDLAKKPKNQSNTLAVAMLIRAEEKARELGHCEGPSCSTVALLRLAESGDIAAILVLSEAMDFQHQGYDELVKNSYVDALKALISARRVNPNEMLRRAAHAGDVASTKALVNTGMPTSALPRDMIIQSQPWEHSATLKTIKLLVTAGASTSTVPDELLTEINRRKQEISDLSPSEKNTALLAAAKERNTTEVAMLLERGAEIAAALKHLSDADDLDGIRTLINAGMSAPTALIDLVRAGEMDVAQSLIRAKDVSAEALIQLIRNKELTLARAFIPALTNGREALVQAAQDTDDNLVSALVRLGAAGPEALLWLLQMKSREQAVRLISSGVDIHTALMLAIRSGSYAAQKDLITMGADLSLALTRAVECEDMATAQQILLWDDLEAGPKTLLDLIEDETVPDDIRNAKLKVLLQMGIDTDSVLERVIENGTPTQLKNLIALGAPTANVLADLGKKGNRRDAQMLIGAGADVATAIETLLQSNEQAAANVLVVAMTWRLWGQDQPLPNWLPQHSAAV
ncbi:hypothetical protein BOTU111921_15205 [Bordetella tumbae]|uniref:hypothetical protein n=1 Tax=Bordetella tumbae TaxID=1649139 RepID=UPI0039F057AB